MTSPTSSGIGQLENVPDGLDNTLKDVLKMANKATNTKEKKLKKKKTNSSFLKEASFIKKYLIKQSHHCASIA